MLETSAQSVPERAVVVQDQRRAMVEHDGLRSYASREAVGSWAFGTWVPRPRGLPTPPGPGHSVSHMPRPVGIAAVPGPPGPAPLVRPGHINLRRQHVDGSQHVAVRVPQLRDLEA